MSCILADVNKNNQNRKFPDNEELGFLSGIHAYYEPEELVGKTLIAITKTWLKSAKIQDVGAYFAVSDAPKEIGAWDSRLQVTSRGYMLGYSDLRDPSVSSFFRFLAKVGDNQMKMQVVKIRFEGRNYNTGK